MRTAGSSSVAYARRKVDANDPANAGEWQSVRSLQRDLRQLFFLVLSIAKPIACDKLNSTPLTVAQ